jgi:hypothetical protein
MAIKTILSVFLLSFIFISCSKDDDENVVTNRISHVGEKWKITSVEYTIVDQNLTNPAQGATMGTATNAGAFYFNSGKGSFDIVIEKYHEEDFFSYTETTTDISITSVSQSVGGSSVSQSAIVISGDKAGATAMTVEGTVTRQSLTSQFVLTGTFNLVKE